MRSNEVRVDSREHISLKFRKHKEYTLYTWEEDANGRIILDPAVLVPARLVKPDSRTEGSLERSREALEVLRDYFPDAKEIPQ